MSLADELLADIVAGIEEEQDEEGGGDGQAEAIVGGGGGDQEMGDQETDGDSIRSIAKLSGSKGELGNGLENCKNNEALQQILTNATIMVVSVTASTTQGQQLSAVELSELTEACDMALGLHGARQRVLDYVQSRMSFIAPNISVIVGASSAAKIMGVAGGLTPLSKMPACNVMLLGAHRTTLSGFSTAAILPHTGFIYHSDIVQALPPDLRKRAARLVAANCSLAAKVDSFHESTDGKVGFELKEEMEKRFDKWQEPPPVMRVKPLPAPLDALRNKRGGRRYHKMKERLGLTDLRKQANRMTFGEGLQIVNPHAAEKKVAEAAQK